MNTPNSQPIANRPNRKASNEDIIRLNSVGLSLATIAQKLNCHPSTITIRLNGLGIPPADTRRTFMEDIYLSLPEAQQDWLAEQLGPHFSVKDFVKNLLAEKYIKDINSRKDRYENDGLKPKFTESDASVLSEGDARANR